jgi:type IV pilus assembly protein PilO
MSEFYAELPITIRVTGAYHDIGAFASDVSQLSRIVTLNDIAVGYDKDGSLSLDAVAKTYRYLDEAEIAAQKKKEKDAKAGAQKK